ncbi:CoA transferase subunit A [Streptomyces piniterrae]|uniref:CoA transferase subunit A n=1 Tax=Streptomyces piniterrae TaxID=2571125 RepID=UPI001FE81A9E|nr:CoA-transferase [Streptomyces piniterrae]
MSADEAIGRLSSGMTIGIGGWGSRRKPMALVRALLRSDLTDLTVVAYGGPDVGLLAAAGKIRRLVAPFATLDSIPLEPHFRTARQNGTIELTELDEAMFMWGLTAAGQRLPFMPVRAGLGSDVLRVNPQLRTVTSPYEDGEELVAVPALRLDAALVHLHRADAQGNGQYLGPDPYFDDLFCEAADAAYVSCERIVESEELVYGGSGRTESTGDAKGSGNSKGPRRSADDRGSTDDRSSKDPWRGPQTMLVKRPFVTGVVAAPNGAHFTACEPDYGRDEAFQKAYATAAADPEEWAVFVKRFLAGDEREYQSAVSAFHEREGETA